MTRQEARCLDAIERLTTPDGISPSYRELQEALSWGSISQVARAVYQLRERGLIQFTTASARSIQIVRQLSADRAAEAAMGVVIDAQHGGAPVTLSALKHAISNALQDAR